MPKRTLWTTQFSICHRLPERSFFYKGKQFPVCARCTGIALGVLTLPFFAFHLLSLSLLTCLLLQLPAYVDGTSQALGWRQSNNLLRFCTGWLCGWGQMGLVALTGDFIIEKTKMFTFFHF